MSITFPANPVNGDTLIYGSLRYTYFEEKQCWKTTKVLGVPAIATLSTTTGTLSSNQSTTVQLTAYSGYMITEITVDAQAWVRIYTGNQDMINDAARTQTEDPEPDSGIVSELISDGSGTFNITPGIYATNSDSPVTNLMYMRITNLGLSSTAITVSVNIIEIGV